MSGITLSSAVLLLTLAVSGIHGYSAGAPVGQCGAMTPNHSPNSAQTGASPFTVTASKATYSGGETITVMVTGTVMFKGFMLQARDASGNRVGTFSLAPQETQMQLLSCDNVQGTAVTHTPAGTQSPKNSINVSWTAPMTNAGAVTFRATVVQKYDTFYLGVVSSAITSSGTNPTTMSNNNNMMTTMNNNNNMMTTGSYAGGSGTAATVSSSVGVLLLALLLSFARC